MIEWIYMRVIEAGEPYFYVHQIISHLIRALSVGSDRHGRLPANNVACGAHRPLEKVEYTRAPDGRGPEAPARPPLRTN